MVESAVPYPESGDCCVQGTAGGVGPPVESRVMSNSSKCGIL